jgi:hypothetical protein
VTQLSKILWFVFTAAVLVLLPGRAAAQVSVTPTVNPTPPGQLIVVNNGPGFNHTDPHVDGDLVCYTDQSNPYNATVRYFNLTTHTDNAVPLPPGAWTSCVMHGARRSFLRGPSQTLRFSLLIRLRRH